MSIVQWLVLILILVVVIGVYLFMRRQAASDPWRDMDEPETAFDDEASGSGDSYVVGVRTLSRETPADRKAAAEVRAGQQETVETQPPTPDRTKPVRAPSPTAVRRRPAPPEPEPEPLPRRSERVRSSEIEAPRGLREDEGSVSDAPSTGKSGPSTAGRSVPTAHDGDVERTDMVAPQPRRGSEIFILHAAAPTGQHYEGRAVHDALVACGLKFGLNDMYHRVTETHGVTESVFAVSNMVKPGTLHPADTDELSTPGLSMFLLVPAPIEGRAAMQDMMETAHRLTQRLGGDVLDDKRTRLKAQSAQFMLDRIAEIDRQALLERQR